MGTAFLDSALSVSDLSSNSLRPFESHTCSSECGKHINHSRCHLNILPELQIQLTFSLVHEALMEHTSSKWPFSSNLILCAPLICHIFGLILLCRFLDMVVNYIINTLQKGAEFIFPLPANQCTSGSRKSVTMCWCESVRVPPISVFLLESLIAK